VEGPQDKVHFASPRLIIYGLPRSSLDDHMLDHAMIMAAAAAPCSRDERAYINPVIPPTQGRIERPVASFADCAAGLARGGAGKTLVSGETAPCKIEVVVLFCKSTAGGSASGLNSRRAKDLGGTRVTGPAL